MVDTSASCWAERVRPSRHPEMDHPTMPTKIPFNKPFIAGKELYYVAQAVTYGNLGGDGKFSQDCCRFLEERFGIHRAMLVPSCTAALEMAGLLFDLKPGDEVILPSFTF